MAHSMCMAMQGCPRLNLTSLRIWPEAQSLGMLEGPPSALTRTLRHTAKRRGLHAGQADARAASRSASALRKRVHAGRQASLARASLGWARRAPHADQGAKAVADAVLRNRMARQECLWRKKVFVRENKSPLLDLWLWLAELSHKSPKAPNQDPLERLV